MCICFRDVLHIWRLWTCHTFTVIVLKKLHVREHRSWGAFSLQLFHLKPEALIPKTLLWLFLHFNWQQIDLYQSIVCYLSWHLIRHLLISLHLIRRCRDAEMKYIGSGVWNASSCFFQNKVKFVINVAYNMNASRMLSFLLVKQRERKKKESKKERNDQNVRFLLLLRCMLWHIVLFQMLPDDCKVLMTECMSL